MQIERHNDRGFLSDIVVRGDMVWIAGTIADSTLTTVEEQTGNILNEIDRRLTLVGSRKDQLLSVSIWLADMQDWPAMNAVWSKWLGQAPSPARAVVQSRLMPPFLVEIAAVACRDA